jgi:hypothetical protein
MAKQQKETSLVRQEIRIPENLNVLNVSITSAEELKLVIRNMKEFALNNYLMLSKIESSKAFAYLGYDSIEEFIKGELKGVISYRNAIGFLDYIHENTDDNEELSDQSVLHLLGIYQEEKKPSESKKKNPLKDKVDGYKKDLELKEQAILEREDEIYKLKDKLNEMALEQGKDPDRVMLIKSEQSLLSYIDKNRNNAIQSIRALKSLDPDLLGNIGYSEIQLTLASIYQAYSEVLHQYEQFFHTEDLLKRLEG